VLQDLLGFKNVLLEIEGQVTNMVLPATGPGLIKVRAHA
jgi:hypothetical protein